MTSDTTGPGAADIRIAVICGDDAIRQPSFDHQSTTIIPLLGNNDSRLMLNEVGCPWARFHLAPNYFKRPRRWRFDRYDLIWNAISDADVNPRVLAVAEKVVAEAGLPVVNAPALVRRTTRDGNARQLLGIPGAVVPNTLRWRLPALARVRQRAEEAALRFPVIVRRAGTHTGEITGVFERPEDLTPIFGDRDNEYYATEFVNYVSPDGIYRKWRLFCIGERMVLRHVLMADSWKINAKTGADFMQGREDLRHEERRHLEAGFEGLPGPARSAIADIRRRIGLDYFGIDFALLPTGDLLLFEVNGTMNFFPFSTDPGFAYKAISLPSAAAATRELVQDLAASRTAAPGRSQLSAKQG